MRMHKYKFRTRPSHATTTRARMSSVPHADSDEPAADEPAADEPGADEPGAEEPAADEPAADEPAADEPGAVDGAADAGSSSDEDERSFTELYAAVVGPLDDVAEAVRARCATSSEGGEAHVERLLLAGADVNEPTTQGWTPLMVSGSTGQPNLMRLLLRWGADIGAKDRRGNGVLDWTRHQVRGHEDDVVLTMPRTQGHEQCAAMFALASQPWSPANHHLFPAAQRAAAVSYLRMGVLLTHRPRCQGGAPLGRAFLDVWLDGVLPAAVCRS